MFREIFYEQFAGIKRREWPKALLSAAFFFLVIATFWILKPLKRGVIINYFGDDPLQLFGLTFAGAESEQIGKVLNLVVVYFVVILFTWLARKVARHHLVLIFGLLFSGAFVLYATLIEQLTSGLVWSFFVFGDIFNTVMVGLFWAFTNDIMQAGEAKRTYFLVGLGGVVGGFVGATVVSTSVEQFGRAPLLLFCVVPMVLIIVIAYVQHRFYSRENGHDVNRAAAPKKSASVAFEGARLVFKSRYLLGILGLVAVYELVSNIIDFQLAATVERMIEADLEKDAFFGLIGQFIGLGSIAVQLLLTGVVMRRFGVRTALFFLPVAIFLGTTGFLVLPTLFFAGAMSVSDNALNYSINQSAREALYVPTSEEVTYKAKAFIDMFVQRFAKVISVVLNLVFAALFVSGVRWLSLVSLGMLGFWLVLVHRVGRRYRERESETADHEDLENVKAG